MRLIDIYNIFASVLFTILVAGFIQYNYRFSEGASSQEKNSSPSSTMPHVIDSTKTFTSWDCFTFFAVLIGCILRLYNLTACPFGFNQDEASIGYDGWSLFTFGIDRNGYRFPIYPITWGSGGGSPLIVYLVGLSQKLVGSNVFGVRIPIALLGCLTIILFVLLIRFYYGSKIGLISAFIISINPWHLMQSRWTLDCNITPFFIIASIMLFLAGVYKKKTVWYILSAVFFALCLYTYGSTTIVIPFYLVIICIIAMRRKVLTHMQFTIGILTFFIVVLPLAVFYAVNYMGLGEIITPWFTIGKFVSKRSVFVSFDKSLPATVWRNFLYIINVCTVGWMSPYKELTQAYLPQYVTMYRFTFPVTILGFVLCIHRSLRGCQRNSTIVPEEMFLFLFIVSALFSLFIKPGISRSTLLFLNVIFFQVIAFEYIIENIAVNHLFSCANLANSISYIMIIIWMGGSILFLRDYFGYAARDFQTYGFMPLYGSAVSYAESIRKDDQKIISTKHSLVSPYMLALFFSHTSPYDFLSTSKYIENDGEFRETNHFTHYYFVLPSFESKDIKSCAAQNDILIIHREESGHFSTNDYEYIQFGNYYVLVPNK